MFLRSKIQEMILRRRSRSMNSSAGAQRSHVPDQLASSSTVPCDGDRGGAGAGGSKSATARALFASPRLLHSSSLPTGTGTVFAKSPVPDAESETAFSMSPTSVLDAAASFRSGSYAVGNSKRRPCRDNGLHGLADALDCGDQQQERIVLAATSPSLLVRSCSLDRRVEFGVKNKGSWQQRPRGHAAVSGRSMGDGAVVRGLHVRHLPRAEPQDGAHLRRPRRGGRRRGGHGRHGELAAADQSAGARRPGLLEPVNDRCARSLIPR